MEIINPWMLYMILQADSIKSSLNFISSWAVLIAGAMMLLSAAMLFVIPTIANSEVVQTEARELYDLAKQGRADLVMEDARKTPPQEATDGRDTAGE